MLRLLAPRWRVTVEWFGETGWKALFGLAALAGFVVVCGGFGLARQRSLVLYAPAPAGGPSPASTLAGGAFAVVAGVLAWAAFAFWLHAWLVGVGPTTGLR